MDETKESIPRSADPAQPRYDRAIEGLFAYHDKIRYCAIVNQEGKVMAHRLREGVTSLTSADEDATIMQRLALVGQMTRSGDRGQGKARCIVLQREKVTIVCYLLSYYEYIFISAAPDFPLAMVDGLGELVDTLGLTGS